MKSLAAALAKRLDALTQRERIVVAAAAALALLAVVYVGGIEPALKQRALLKARIADQRNQMAAAEAQRQALTQAAQQDPNAAIRERIAAKQREVAAVDAQFSGLQRTLVAPDRMPDVLEELVGGSPQVALVSLRNLPPVPLVGGGEAAAAAPPRAPVYRHGVEIVVEGAYLDVLAYVARVERQPWRVYWGRTVMAADYPKVMLTLTLYTLSLDRAWLVV
jgi:MSHA biogenesis protein MshJ